MPQPPMCASASSSVSGLAQSFTALLGQLGVDATPRRPNPEADLCARSLHEFYRHMWTVLEPGTTFSDNWHIGAICEHLEAVVRGEIRELLVNMPPRFSKSTLISVALPAWIWILQPWFRSLFSSYAQSLSTRDSVLCRRVIMSPWYQSNWGHVFQLTTDQNIKQRYENDKTGVRLATSVGAAVTGEGGDLIVADDPHNVIEATSDAVRQATLDWWDQSMSTRLNDPKTGRKIIVMQRVHHNDLAGHVLESGDYYHLCLPMEWTGEKPQWIIGWTDPRTKEGDLLWPERYPRAEVEKLKRALGSYGTAAQLQQVPTPAEGGVFKRAWFKEYTIQPAMFLRIIESWDTATTEADYAAYSVGTVWGETAAGDLYLLDVARGRYEFPALKRAVAALHARWNGAATLVEDKSSGRQIVQELGRNTMIPLIPIKVTGGDKLSRAMAVSPVIEAGRVFIPANAPWVAAYMQEILTFPRGKFADQVDSTTQALSYLRGGGVTTTMDLS